MKSTLLTLSAILIGCSVNPYGTAPSNTQPDTQVVSTPDSLPKTDIQSSSATVTATSTTTKTEEKTDAGIPDSLPAQTTPDAQVQAVQIDAQPAAQDTLPQVTTDTQPAQQPDAQPMAVDTKPATPDTLVLVDTKTATPDTLVLVDIKPTTPDVLPVIDTKPAEDNKPVTTDTQPAACGGDNQSCCVTQAVDTAGYWIHTCVDSVKGTYDCTITLSTGTTPGPSGTCMTCGYKGYPGCTHLNLGMFSWKLGDVVTGTCDHDSWQTPVCSADGKCLCP